MTFVTRHSATNKNRKRYGDELMDVTEALPQQKAAKLTRVILQKLVDSTSFVVWTSDARGDCQYLNPGSEAFVHNRRLFSLPNWLAHVHPHDHGRAAEIYKGAQGACKDYQHEYRLVRSDGSIRRVLSVGAPRFTGSGEFTGYVGAIVDITSRYAKLDRLEKSDAEFRLITENSSDIITHHNAEGALLFISPSCSRILGYESAELLGVGIYGLTHADDTEMLRNEIQRQVNGETDDTVVEFRVRHKDGHYLWMATRATVLLDPLTKEKIGTVSVSRDVTHERIAKEELRRSEERFRSLTHLSSDWYWETDAEDRFTFLSEGLTRIFGDVPSLIGMSRALIVKESNESGFQEYLRKIASRERFDNLVYTTTWFDGANRHLSISGEPVYDHDVFIGYRGIGRDITDEHKAEIAIRESEQRFRDVIEMTPSGYILADENGVILDVNPALCALTGHNEDEIVGQKMAFLFPTNQGKDILGDLTGPTSFHNREVVLNHKKGHLVHILLNANIRRDESSGAHSFTGFVTDITTHKRTEARLEQLATHDALTGLPNRARLNDQLQEMLDSAINRDIVVMFIDLDRFKQVNDTMGHESGDALLRSVSRRLQKILRPDDIVARLGGDEFIVAAQCSNGRESAARIAEKLLGSLIAPFDIDGQEVFVGASIGISVYPHDGHTKELLFQNADTAMYEAKAAGRNGFRFFEAEMSIEAKHRVFLENSLRRALEREEFELHYQPRLNLLTREVVGVEALVRWVHPQLGMVSPAEFIPLAEDRGFIDGIGKWVLEEACRETKQLSDRLGKPLKVSVNVSARQLRGQTIVYHVRTALAQSGLSPSMLELELTESALIEDLDVTVMVLKALKSLGVAISIDDFGTGYSGLSYLRKFPIDTLKLDRSFIVQEDEGISAARFIKAFVDLAHALNLRVVAEGVETKENVELLNEARCDEVQGYYFARPLTLAQLANYLQRSRA